MLSSPSLRGRLAPSPTGVLHLGNARSFLLAWLDIRSRGGDLLLRIEDLDGPRVRAGASDAALEDLKWLGLDWDRGPLFQFPRFDFYRAALGKLAKQGVAYPCVCRRGDVIHAASAPHESAALDGHVYPGTCRGRWTSAEEALSETGREACWRFDVGRDRVLAFEDRILGPQEFEMDSQLGDFVIWRRGDSPAYQLAVVLDDADQQINEVLRGDDLIPSTARQCLLQESLGLPRPQWAHVALVVGEDGQRLAKRHGDTTLRKLRLEGRSAEDVVGLLAFWSGLRKSMDPVSASDLVQDFVLRDLPREPLVWSGHWPQ